ncbi:hypothetical protein BVX97_01310 [bacterium E08(2017)]|nr:hypothetical protein BVX97_01310 [bacterium E08(2017)]
MSSLKSLKSKYGGMLKDSSLLMLSGLISGALYFCVHIVLIRKMAGESYAMFVALMALLKFMTVPSMALMTSMARYTSQFVSERAIELWVTLAKRAMRRLAILGVAALIVWSLASSFVKDWMGVPSRLNIIILGVVAFLGLFTPVVQGLLQGARKFGWLAASGISNAAARLVLCIISLAIFNSQVSPMLAAVAGGACVCLAIGVWPLKKIMMSVKAIADFDTKPIYKYFWPVFFGQGAVYFLTELDLLLAPKCLTGDELGAYSKAAMLTRCIFLFTQPLAIALFPRAVVSRRKALVLGTLALSIGVSAVAACFVYFFTDLPVRLFIGDVDPMYGDILRKYVWAALPLSVMSILTPYLWARNRLTMVLGLVPVAVLYALLRVRYSATPYEMIMCLAIAVWLAAIILSVATYRELSRPDQGEGSSDES